VSHNETSNKSQETQETQERLSRAAKGKRNPWQKAHGQCKKGHPGKWHDQQQKSENLPPKKFARQMPKSNIQTSVCDSQNSSTKTFTEAQAKAAVPGAAL